MLSKKFRLKEKEVRKVLQRWKPFFSYDLVLNHLPNKLNISRFAIVIWSASVQSGVERNFFRRRFYDLVRDYVWKINWYDLVFVVKKKTKLDKKNIDNYKNNIKFLVTKSGIQE